MKTYLKTIARMFKRHITRFLAILAMVLVSIGLISGIGSATDMINNSLTDYYVSQNVGDLILKSRSEGGFTQEEIATVERIFKGAEINTGISIDLKTGEKRSLRLYFLDFKRWTVNVPDLVEGEYSTQKTQVYCEQKDDVIKGYALGESVTLDFKEIITSLIEQNGGEPSAQILAMLDNLKPVEVTVCGIMQSPLTFSDKGEPSYNNGEDIDISDGTVKTKDLDCLENILYLSSELIPHYKDANPYIPDEANKPFIPTGDMYVAIESRDLFRSFSKNYKKEIDACKKLAQSNFSNIKVITLYDNLSFYSLKSYCNKVANIGYVIMSAFLLVTALVVFSTMTRLLDEERAQIACLKTLGFSSGKIVFKYLLFALIATGIGGFGAYFVGLGLARFIYSIFDSDGFCMPPISANIPIIFYIITFTVIVAGTLLSTALSGYKMCNDKPANLLRPKPPKSARKIALEKLPFIWNKLSFKYKSTCRNVFRYKGRFFMTVIAVAFSTALVLAGLGILDLCLMHDFGSVAIMGIAIIIVIFAGLLTGIVIYTLTNINISERNREIATLMVLGYYDSEVSGYIYREIYITSAIGILLGYPVSLFLLYLVFSTIGVGTIGGISWFMWLIAPVVVMIFTFLITIMLRSKIIKIDMNESLKAIE